MAITVTPKFTSAIPDDPAVVAAGYVGTERWNNGSDLKLDGGGRLVGRVANDNGAAEEITLGAGLKFDSLVLALDLASTAEIRAKNAEKPLTMGNAVASAEWVNLNNLSGAVALNFASWLYARATLTGNITLGEPQNLPAGVYVLHVTHSGAARTITLNASFWDTAGGAGLTLSTTAGQSDLLTIIKKPGGKALISVSGLNVGA